MESQNGLKEIVIKHCACYYLDDIIHGTGININDILFDEKLYEKIWVCEISYKTSMGQKPRCIRFEKIDGLTMVLDGKIKHLVLFDYGLFDKICGKISKIFK